MRGGGIRVPAAPRLFLRPILRPSGIGPDSGAFTKQSKNNDLVNGLGLGRSIGSLVRTSYKQ